MIDEMRISDLEIDVSTGIMKNNDTYTHYYLNEKKVVIRTNDAGVGIDQDMAT